jgi:hypothetical protein
VGLKATAARKGLWLRMLSFAESHFMSVRFAPAHNPVRLIGWHARGRGLVWPAQTRVANDDSGLVGGAVHSATTFDPMLTDALRHFAMHGLSAVDTALDEAEQAQAAGDGQAKTRWLAITGMFDRRRAAAASRHQTSD